MPALGETGRYLKMILIFVGCVFIEDNKNHNFCWASKNSQGEAAHCEMPLVLAGLQLLGLSVYERGRYIRAAFGTWKASGR